MESELHGFASADPVAEPSAKDLRQAESVIESGQHGSLVLFAPVEPSLLTIGRGPIVALFLGRLLIVDDVMVKAVGAAVGNQRR